jgi:hypothetical protein
MSLLGLRGTGFLLAAAATVFLVLSFAGTYEGDPSGPAAIDRAAGIIGVLLGFGIGYAGFTDERHNPRFRFQQTLLLVGSGVVLGAVVGFVIGIFV